MSQPSFRALILDFDGTILDTETVEFEVWKETFETYGVELPLSLWADSIGRGANDIKFDPVQYLRQQVGSTLDIEAALEQRRVRLRHRLLSEPIRPGIVEYIEDAKERGFFLGVASSSRHDWVDTHLDRLGLRFHFNCICCADDVERAKPAPDLYLLACETLGVTPPETIAIEDSPHGLQAARAAKVYAVAFPNPLTALLNLSHADRLVPSLVEFPLSALLAAIAAESRKKM